MAAVPFSLRTSLAVALCWLPAILRAEPPAQDDAFLRDYAETRGFVLGRPVNATPAPDGKSVLFLRAVSAREPSQELYEFDVASSQTRRLVSPQDALKGASDKLSPEEKARRERQRISVGGFTAFSVSKDSALVLLQLSGKLYVLTRASGEVAELATGAGTILDPKFSPDSKSVAYVRNYDVCVCDLATGKERALTAGGTETISHGLAEFVAQEEMARFSGYWWSPDSRSIVYQEDDASKVESWFASDPAQPGNEPLRSFYPRPGKENVAVRLGIVSAGGGEKNATVWFDWDHAKYSYLGKVTWSEHGPLTLTVLSRDQTDLALLKADSESGKTSVLLTEHDAAWVNLPQDVPLWLSAKDGREFGGSFLWASERDGWRQLEAHSANGTLEEVLTAQTERFHNLITAVDGVAYVTLGYGGPGFSFVDHVWLSSDVHMPGNLRPMNAELSQANFGDCQTVYALQNQSLTEMPRTDVVEARDGKVIGELPSVALNPPAAPNAEVQWVGTKAPGDVEADANYHAKEKKQGGYYTITIRPRDFNPTAQRKYPVIVNVYGGPSHQQVVASMRSYLLDQWLADQGFIVVAIDGRGTPGRGRDWERAIAGHFGSVPLDDQVEALKLLGAEHPEMDMDRVGITGWSFGGYMAALAVLRRPDVFKAAVAGAPVVDWMDYDTCYTERYLGVPDAGRWPDAYKEGSLLTYAADLKRPLLLIHGTADDNVYLRHSLRLIDALFRAGRPFEFMPLSGFTHMVPDPVVRIQLEKRIAEYFQKRLATP